MTVREEVKEIELSHIRTTQGTDRLRDIDTLAKSIAAIGLQIPLIVQHIADGGDSKGNEKYLLVDGHRRLAALQKNKSKTARVIEIADDTPGDKMATIQLTANLHRLQLTAFEEAAAIKKLRDDGRDTKDIAADLGLTPKTIARRERLNHLIPAWQKRASTIESIAALELIASLPDGQQELLNKDFQHWTPDLDQVRGRLENKAHLLATAPWKLDDTVLHPVAGACNVCPKRTSCQPLLFDGEFAKGKANANTDRCLDTACWETKRSAQFKQRFEKVTEEHKDVVLIRTNDYRSGNVVAVKNNQAVLESHQYERVKKGEKGAKPAVMVNGGAPGELVWISTGKSRATQSSGSAPKKPSAEVDRQARRAKFIIGGIEKHISVVERIPAGLKAQSSDDKIKMLASLVENCSSRDKEDWPKIAKFKSIKLETAVEILAERILGDCDIPVTSFATALEWISPVRPFAETVLGMKWSELEEQALEQIPDPKPKAGAAPKKKAGKK